MNQDHRKFSDHDFIRQLEDECLAPELFTHEAHVRAAWLYLKQKPPREAISCISKVIRAMDRSGTKYHHTITLAFTLLICKAMRKRSAASWVDFINENSALCAGKGILSSWYSDEVLANGISRGIFVPPDKTAINQELLLLFFEADSQ